MEYTGFRVLTNFRLKKRNQRETKTCSEAVGYLHLHNPDQ